jgi:group I intron endonuclease
MKFIFSDKANKSGIYKIINIQNGRIYIGSTSRFKDRARSHKNDLEMNRHSNDFLQNDFNKCGTNSFIFEILEICSDNKDERLKREQFFIDQFYENQKNCYNLTKNAKDNRSGRKNRDPTNPITDLRCRPLSDEHKNRISESNKEVWQEDADLRRQALADANKRWDNVEFPEYKLTNIDTNESVIIKSSLREWCLEKNLSYKSMNLLVNGKIKISQGWFLGENKPVYVERKGEKRKPLTEEHKAKIARSSKSEAVVLMNWKTNEKYESFNLKEFSRNHNLDFSTLCKVVKGVCPSVGDFILFNNNYNKPIVTNKGNKYNNILVTALENKTFPWKILNVCLGKQKESQGVKYNFVND